MWDWADWVRLRLGDRRIVLLCKQDNGPQLRSAKPEHEQILANAIQERTSLLWCCSLSSQFGPTAGDRLASSPSRSVPAGDKGLSYMPESLAGRVGELGTSNTRCGRRRLGSFNCDARRKPSKCAPQNLSTRTSPSLQAHYRRIRHQPISAWTRIALPYMAVPQSVLSDRQAAVVRAQLLARLVTCAEYNPLLGGAYKKNRTAEKQT